MSGQITVMNWMGAVFVLLASHIVYDWGQVGVDIGWSVDRLEYTIDWQW